jgi:hypothetical protein
MARCSTCVGLCDPETFSALKPNSMRPGVEPDDEVVGLLNAIGRGPDRDKQSLYWQAAALIPV